MIHVQFRHVFVWAYLLLTAYVNLQYGKTKIEWFLILLHCYMWILFGALCLKMGAVCQNCICLFPAADLLATLPTAYLTGPDQPRDVPCYFRNQIESLNHHSISTLTLSYTMRKVHPGTSRSSPTSLVFEVRTGAWPIARQCPKRSA